MIKRIIIHNFMSHKHTELDFSDHITLLAGSSFSGKSAIMDAIKWVTDNRPTGDSYVSYWCRDDKGRQINDTYVTLEFDDHVVTRYRGKDGNRYLLDNMPLDAIGTDVPEPVRKAVNFAEVNSQNQMDPLFLLSSTGGDVARLLNKTTKLDLIDVFLSSIDSKKRATKKDIDAANTNIENVSKELKGYTFLPQAEKLIQKAGKYAQDSDAVATVVQSLTSGIQRHEACIKIINAVSGAIMDAEVLSNRISLLLSKREDLSILERSVQQYLSSQKVKEQDTTKAEKLISKVSRYVDMLQEDNMAVVKLSVSKEAYTKAQTILNEFDKEYKELRDALPSSCPVCGKPLEECDE